MLIITSKEKDNIDRILKRYKKKVEKTNLINQVKNGVEYTKPSKRRRDQKQKAIYTERYRREQAL
ncbi:MAG: 30S ribosomal protein S21 [Bacteroidota bacterium]